MKQNYSTQYSRVVPHHSTDWAITSLTSQIGRDAVLSSVYGRSWYYDEQAIYIEILASNETQIAGQLTKFILLSL